MLSAPEIVYRCLTCGQLVVTSCLLFDNISGSKLFSDGKQIAPLVPEVPFFIKCKKCNAFYWLKKENKVATLDYDDKSNELESADLAQFLLLDEYQEALNLKVYKDTDEENYIRLKLWWAFNDKIRNNANDVFSANEQKIYEGNCSRLIDILDRKDASNRIIIAELFRNIGRFYECIKTLETINEEKYNWIKRQMETVCSKRNKKVIELTTAF